MLEITCRDFYRVVHWMNEKGE